MTGYCKQYIKFFPHQDNFFNKLSNLSEFEYANLIQYDEDNFVKNVVIDVGNIHEASSLTNISEEKIKKDMKHLYKDKYFYEGDNDVMKDCVITDDLDTDELDFYWTNEHFYFSRFYTILSVKLYNKSHSTAIQQFLNKVYYPYLDCGIACRLLDNNKNVICDPYCYGYINHTIFPHSVGQIILNRCVEVEPTILDKCSYLQYYFFYIKDGEYKIVNDYSLYKIKFTF